MKKLLVIGIIALFIGLAFIPSFNAVSISISDDTTPPVTTHSLDPPEPDGNNGWYVSDVEIILTATDDMSGVKTIYYKVGDGLVQTISGDNAKFVVDEEGDNLPIEYWAIDNAENEETHHTFYIDMDQTRPYIDLKKTINIKPFSYNLTNCDVTTVWTIILNATATDETSGIERVEFYLNYRLQETVYGPGPYYIWSFLYSGGLNMRLPAYAYDYAGNFKYDEIVDPGLINFQQSIQSLKQTVSDSEENCDCKSNGKTHLAEKLINRLEKNEILSKVIDLNKQDYRPICPLLNYILDTIGFKLAYCLEKLEETKGTIWNYYYFYLATTLASIGYFYGMLWILFCYEEPYYP